MQLLATWSAARELVLPILLGRVLLGLIPIGFASALLWGVTRVGHPTAVLTWTASLTAGRALAGLWLPLSVGLMAYLYRRCPHT